MSPKREPEAEEKWTTKEDRGLSKHRAKMFLLHYAPGKKLFQIVVKLSDAPGSYRKILDLLSDKVNLIGTNTYSLEDGTAIFSGVSESLSPKTSPEELQSLIMSSDAAIEAKVLEGKDGLLVDTFHMGPEVNGLPFMLFRRKGLKQMFDKVVQMLGSGGEAIIYHEAFELGRDYARSAVDLLGREVLAKRGDYLSNFNTAEGWGVVESRASRGGSVIVRDCFECDGDKGPRTECNFFRGFFAGTASFLAGRDVGCKEVECRLKGAEACEFVITGR